MSVKELPLDSGTRIYKVFESIGLHYEGLSEKNHHILTDPKQPYLFISIPNHKTVDRQTLKAEVGKLNVMDSKFRQAYDAYYDGKKSPGKVPATVELPICPLCREDISDGDETVTQTSGLPAHKKCHDQTFGSPTPA